MIVLGVILLILGLFFSSVLFWLGVALILLGLFLNFAGPVGPTGTRRRYY
jgi:hypothetical protein